MNSKVLTILEYDKIIDMLCDCVSGEYTQSKLRKLKPSSDFNEVAFMLNETDEAVSALLKFSDPPSVGISFENEALDRAKNGGTLSIPQLLSISRLLRIIKQYINYGENLKEFHIINKYIENLIYYPKVEKEIEGAILNEEELKDNASSELFSIRRSIKSANDKIRTMLNEYISSPKYTKFLQELLITTRNGRYVIPVKAECKGEINGIVHDTSASGATLFIEPVSIVESNNKIRQLQVDEKEEIERILSNLSASVSEIHESMRENIRQLLNLEIVFAKAKFSLKINGEKPKLNDKHIINLKKARHPLLDKNKAVPIDIRIGDDFDTLVITGPNTGGKTVSLKTIGLLQLMVQSGIYIPTSSQSEVSVFEKIYADIGDEQSIEQSLSTFSAHMTNIVKIINRVDSNTLILFDELGAGTDPIEGAALAISILERTKKSGAKTVATTHYSEIKMYALSSDRIENASCEFDVQSLRPTYRLITGVPGKSNAFAISEKIGLPKDIIDNAQKHISNENIKFEDLLSELETQRVLAEKEHSDAVSMKAEAEEYKSKLEVDIDKIDRQKVKILNDAYAKAKQIVENAQRETEEKINEIINARKTQGEEKTLLELQKIKKELKNKSKKITSKIVVKEKKVPGEPVKNLIPGTEVYVVDTDTNGTVLTAPDKKGNVVVQTGIIKMTVSVNSLRKIEEDTGKKAVIEYNRTTSGIAKTLTLASELDLRGLYPDEAAAKTEKFIDDAMMSSLKTVTIVHGKGTGVLKKTIHELLKTYPYVKSYRLGNYGEGDSGVTVVELN